jgi:hypothetical protein
LQVKSPSEKKTNSQEKEKFSNYKAHGSFFLSFSNCTISFPVRFSKYDERSKNIISLMHVAWSNVAKWQSLEWCNNNCRKDTPAILRMGFGAQQIQRKIEWKQQQLHAKVLQQRNGKEILINVQSFSCTFASVCLLF